MLYIFFVRLCCCLFLFFSIFVYFSVLFFFFFKQKTAYEMRISDWSSDVCSSDLFLASFPQMRIAVISVDPTRRRTGGALLGDRIRMNSLRSHRVYMRSMATRRQHAATNVVLKDGIAFLKSLGYDLVIVETAGIGQSDSEIVDLVDFPMYVMTSDYGAASQLEKIDMIDFAELIVLNRSEEHTSEAALRDIRKQW